MGADASRRRLSHGGCWCGVRRQRCAPDQGWCHCFDHQRRPRCTGFLCLLVLRLERGDVQMIRPTLCTTLALLVTAATATAQTPSQARFLGTWEGTLDAGTVRLRTALVVERDSAQGLKGVLISIDQGNARV